jgi:hypothetical protein
VTDEQKIQMAREALARQLAEHDNLKWESLKPKATNITDGPTQSFYLRKVALIEATCYPNGQPMFAVLDDEQEMPVKRFRRSVQGKGVNYSEEKVDFTERVELAMFDEGWRKILIGYGD